MITFVGTTQKDKEAFLYFYQINDGHTFFKLVMSHDGFTFTDKGKYVFVFDDKKREEKNYNWKGFRVAKQDKQFVLTYLVNNQILTAVSSDLIRWKKTGKISNITETATIIPDFQYKNQHIMYYGEKTIQAAYTTDWETWKTDNKVLFSPRKDYFDNGDLEVGNAYVIDEHILLTYYVKKQTGRHMQYIPGAVLFEKINPTKPIWQSNEPLWEPVEELQNEKMLPLGSVIIHDELIFYWLINDTSIFAVSCQIPNQNSGLKNKLFSTIFKKFEKNPIIAPVPHHPWESRAAFNSAAVYEDGKVHFVYRALGDKDLSVLGYATSSDGLTIDERSKEPIYIPREPFETPGQQAFKTFADHFASGGGYGGVEDPRLTRVEDTFFMTYVAFDGANPPRVALTSIAVEDFLNRRWDKWEQPKLISAPGMVNKNAVIFPEKINGKYVVYHRIYPNILIDYVDDLKFDNDKYLQGHHFITPRKKHWDSKKIGAGAPPIKTKDGWLFVYQSVGHQDPGKYKIGAMLLAHNDPAKVLYRTNSPIVEPVESYENEGFKAGVVYPCGAVVVNNKLHVYYGGADTVVCAASTDLDKFLWEMKHNQEPKLKKVKSAILN
ncbi:MAG TPA: hypothetical protein VE090_02260 [Methylomirabilota bacterium]|nr:hypothetical protein [Methylomirabilota bacterium]